MAKDKDQLYKTPHNASHVKTLYELQTFAAEKYKDKPCLGDRKIIRVKEKEEEIKEGEETQRKTRKYYELDKYTWKTFRDFHSLCHIVGKALVSKEGLHMDNKYHKLGIFAGTSKEWFVMSHGCFTQNITVVTVFPNLGEEGWIHAINQCELELLFVDFEALPTVKVIHKECERLSCVIYKDDPSASRNILDELKDMGIRTISYDELIEIGKHQEDVEQSPPAPDDLAFIMYTSGTTGMPKGVMVSHANVVAAIAGALPVFEDTIDQDDVYICLLPLAHVMEMVIENALLLCGVSLGYGSPRTMTRKYVLNCQSDLEELRPTLMSGVPAVWETMRKTVLSEVKKSGATARFIFKMAYIMKSYLLEHGFRTPIIDFLVFRKAKKPLGGHLKFIVSGAAPLSAETHQFLRICICYRVSQCYGLTETTGPSTLMAIDDMSTEKVGFPSLCCEVKLEAVPEMGYSPTNDSPTGEICFRGFNVSQAYYKDEEKTKEAFQNGWFYSGDIGMWHPDGNLSIIDRRKNLVKLSNGEYIALEYLESKYKNSTLIENICIHADSHTSNPVALVIPAEQLAHLEGYSPQNASKVKEEIMKDIHSIAEKEKMKSHERIRDISLVWDEWTPENKMLTPALKLKRNTLLSKYKKQIDEMCK